VKYHEDFGNTLDFDFGILQLFLAPMIITRDPQNVPLGHAWHSSVIVEQAGPQKRWKCRGKGLSIVVFISFDWLLDLLGDLMQTAWNGPCVALVCFVSIYNVKPRSSKKPLRVIKFRSCTMLINGDGSKPWYLVNPKIVGKWMFIPLKMVLIGIDPYPNLFVPFLGIAMTSARNRGCPSGLVLTPSVAECLFPSTNYCNTLCI